MSDYMQFLLSKEREEFSTSKCQVCNLECSTWSMDWSDRAGGYLCSSCSAEQDEHGLACVFCGHSDRDKLWDDQAHGYVCIECRAQGRQKEKGKKMTKTLIQQLRESYTDARERQLEEKAAQDKLNKQIADEQIRIVVDAVKEAAAAGKEEVKVDLPSFVTQELVEFLRKEGLFIDYWENNETRIRGWVD